MKFLIISIPCLAGILLVSCQPDPVYVPVYVPVEQQAKKPAPKKVKPRPVESAEGFRAVEKPGTYSN